MLDQDDNTQHHGNKDENAIIPEHHHPTAGKRIKIFVRFPRIFLVSGYKRCHKRNPEENHCGKRDILHVGKRHIDNHRKESVIKCQSPGKPHAAGLSVYPGKGIRNSAGQKKHLHNGYERKSVRRTSRQFFGKLRRPVNGHAVNKCMLPGRPNACSHDIRRIIHSCSRIKHEKEGHPCQKKKCCNQRKRRIERTASRSFLFRNRRNFLKQPEKQRKYDESGSACRQNHRYIFNMKQPCPVPRIGKRVPADSVCVKLTKAHEQRNKSSQCRQPWSSLMSHVITSCL